eukprot:TCALIF_06606-PA protein Name:"Protein of unknown function" AED:0.44 eAED:0.56 QI:68/0.33/0.5/1/0.33/0.5/4/0/145
MQLSRQILVLTPDQPFQYCYNATLPFLYSICDPSKSLYCSKKRPEFGCTKIREDACINFHFCNTPPVSNFSGVLLFGFGAPIDFTTRRQWMLLVLLLLLLWMVLSENLPLFCPKKHPFCSEKEPGKEAIQYPSNAFEHALLEHVR